MTCVTGCSEVDVVSVSISLLLYAFAALTTPCLARQAIRRIWVRFPVALDLGAAGTVGVGTGAANGSDLAAFLTVFDGLGAASLGVLDGLGGFFFHIVKKAKVNFTPWQDVVSRRIAFSRCHRKIVGANSACLASDP